MNQYFRATNENNLRLLPKAFTLMFKSLSFTLFSALLCLLTIAQPTNPVPYTPAVVPVAYNLDGQSVFIENKGQLADNEGKPLTDVLFKLRLAGMDVYFRKTGLSFVLQESVEQPNSTVSASSNPLDDLTNLNEAVIRAYRLDLVWENSHADVAVLGSMPAGQKLNYYYGHCPNGVTNVQSFEKLTYHNAYKGIDLEFYTKKIDGILRLKYDIVVHPGADPTLIQLKYLTDKLPAGVGLKEIIFNTPLGEFQEHLGQIYQTIEHKTAPIAGNYNINNGVINFDIPHYDPAHILIIDPFFTYYGGNAADQGAGINTDSKDSVLVVGTSQNSGLFVTLGLQNFAGVRDAFVVKLDAAGNRLWSTYYGGSVDDFAADVTVDGNDNVFFTGSTRSSNFPVTAGGGALLGSADAYAVSLIGGTGIRNWARYHGGEAGENALGIAADKNNNIIICGSTSSSGLPIAGCLPSSYKGGTATAGDAFITRFDNTGLILWSTYLGGASDEIAYAVTTDNANNVLVTGYTQSGTDFTPALNPARSSYDVFLVKYDVNCGFKWGLRYGGLIPGTERGIDVAVHPVTYEIVVVGSTTAADFPATPPTVVRNVMNGPVSSIITKFDSAGTMLWSSYFGGEAANGVEIDNDGDIWITGYSDGDIPTTPTALQPNYGGSNDAFVANITANGEDILCASYYGGSGNDQGNAIALDNIGNVLICGATTSASLPKVGVGSLQSSLKGASDAFIASMCTNCGLPQDSAFIVDTDTLPYTNDTILICTGDTAHLMNLFDFTTSLGYKSVNYNVNQATYSWYNITAGDTANLGDPTVKVVATDNAWIKVSPAVTTTYRLISKAIDCRIDTSYITVTPIASPGMSYGFKQDSICPAEAPHSFVVFPHGMAPWTLEIKKPDGTIINHPCAGMPCNITATDSGDYVIQKITDSKCFKILNDTFELDFYATPSAVISGDTSICPGDSAKLCVKLTGTKNWRYRLTKNNSLIDTLSCTTTDTCFWVQQTDDTVVYKITWVEDSRCDSALTNISAKVILRKLPLAKITNPADTLFMCPVAGNTVAINVALTGTSPFTLRYTHPLIGSVTTTTLTNLGSSHTITTATEGWYKLIYVKDICDSILADSIYVKHYALPNTSFSLSKDTICLGDSALYTLILSGKPNFIVTGTANLGLPPSITTNSWSKWLKPTSTDTFVVTKIKDGNSCESLITLDTTIVVKFKPTASVTTTCNAASTHFTLTVTLNPNNPPNTVIENLPGGTTSSWNTSTNTWTSGLIPVGPYDFDFDDKNGCGPIKISGNKTCNCITRVGTVNTTPQLLCTTQNSSNPHNGDQVLDNDDVLEFILHTAGSTVTSNNTGIFPFDPSKMSCGTVYYITAAAGNKLTSNPNQADPADGCYLRSADDSVIWHCLPTLSETHTDSVCPGDSALVTLTLTGNRSPFDVILNNGSTVTLSAINNNHSFKFKVDNDTCFVFTGVQYTNAPACLQNIVDSLCVDTFSRPAVQNITYTCNGTSTQYQVSFTIVGGDVPSLVVNGTPTGGSLTGSTYTSGWINAGTTYNFVVNDKNNCQPVPVTGTHSCVCISDAGTAQNTIPLDLCENTSATYPHNGDQVLDGNDLLGYVFHTDTSPYFGTVLDHNTTGVFPFDPSKGMKHDSTYFITALAGNQLGIDSVDMNDPCLDTGMSVPVVFRALPDLLNLTVSPNDSICNGDSVNLNLTFTGSAPFTYQYNQSPFSGFAASTAESIPSGPLNSTRTYTFTQVQDFRGCSRAVNKSITVTVGSPLNTTAVLTPILCTGDIGSIQVTTAGGFGGYDYFWTNSAGDTVGDDSPVFDTVAPDIYQVRITDVLGCQDNYTDTLDPSPLFGISFIGILNEICFAQSNGQVQVTAPDGKLYKMDGSITKIWQTSDLFVNLSYQSGPNTLTITVESINGCIEDSTVFMTGLYPISITNSSDQTICSGDCITLIAVASGGNGNFCYSWNGLACGPSSTITICPTNTGTITIQAFDSKNCPSALQTITITVPSALTQIVSPDDTVCQGELVTLSTSTSGGSGSPTYEWSNTNGVVGTGPVYSFTANSSDTYTITTSDLCDTVVDTITITVTPHPVADFIAPVAEGCVPLTVTFNNLSTGTFDQCTWKINGTALSGGSCQGLTYVFNTPGTYNAELEVKNQATGCSSSLPKPGLIKVYKLARANFTYDPDKVTLLDPSIFTHNFSTDAASYTWTIDGVVMSSDPEPKLSFPREQEGQYLVCLEANNPGGCNDTLCKTVIVHDEVTLYVPNTFTPNEDGHNEVFKATGAGFDETFFSLTIFDRWGEVVFSSTNVNQAWNGTYMGAPAKTDHYIWKIVTRPKNSGAKFEKIGSVNLLR